MNQTEFQTDAIRSVTFIIDINAQSSTKRQKEKLKDAQ